MNHNHPNQNLAVVAVTTRRNTRTPSANETWLRAAMPMLLALLVSGCATGGIYRNQSTPDRIDVVATDQAAVEAAKSAQSQGSYSGGAYRGAGYSPPSPYQQLQNNVSQALVNSASSALSGAIYSLVSRVAYH